MRLFDVDKSIQEAIPGLGPQPGTSQPAPTSQPAATSQPAKPAIGAPQPAAGQAVDPATAALAKKQMEQQKKQIQDAIAAKEKELQDLRKQLAQIR